VRTLLTELTPLFFDWQHNTTLSFRAVHLAPNVFLSNGKLKSFHATTLVVHELGVGFWTPGCFGSKMTFTMLAPEF
jgi:hypothetical protein